MSNNLDAAVMATTRKIRTGAADRPTSAQAFIDAICSKMVDGPAHCRDRLGFSVELADNFAEAQTLANVAPAGQYDAGGPGDIVLVRATYRLPLILPMYTGGFELVDHDEALIAARAAFRNEPYA